VFALAKTQNGWHYLSLNFLQKFSSLNNYRFLAFSGLPTLAPFFFF